MAREPEFASGPLSPRIPGWAEHANERARMLAAPILLALLFLNAQNVRVPEVCPDRKLNRVRKEHGRRPFVAHRTIDIGLVKQTLSRQGRVETVGLKKALHDCRGHFANYGPDKPMFGRLVGRYWIPPHQRGSAELGKVDKDYRINRPA